MKRYGVSLDVISMHETMPDFFRDIDSERLSTRKLRDGTLWRLESDIEDSSSLLEGIEEIFSLIAPAKVKGPGIHAHLSIAVYYDTATCSIQIPREWIAMLQGSEIAIEITCYPTSEESPSTSRPH